MEQREAGGPKTFMEMILILWTIGLTLWSLYLFIASLSIHKRRTAFQVEQHRWVKRAEMLRREKL
jgi:hypothetical protein